MLSWSLKIGSVRGIPIFIHWTFLILIAWIMAGPLLSGTPGAAAEGLRSAAFVLAVFACVVLHELGHALAARRFGIRTIDITLLPIGGVARLEKMPEKPMQELIVALAGPAVNAVIAALVVPAVLATAGAEAFTGAAAIGHHRAHFLASLGAVNVTLLLFNLIPAFPMDGGRVLRALLAMSMGRPKATRIAAIVGQALAVVFALLGLLNGHVLLMLVALFVFLGAGAEAHAEQFRSALRGLPASAAMITRFVCLRESDTLRRAVQELLAGSQQDFPVLADGAGAADASALVGVLTRADLLRALAEGIGADPAGDQPTVGAIMRRPCPVALEDEDLQAALDRVRAEARCGPDGAPADAAGIMGCPVIAVVRRAPEIPPRDDPSGRAQGRLVGVLTPDNVVELVMIRSASERRRDARAVTVPASR